MQRAAGRCEACGKRTLALVMDHWLGGWGRRRQLQSPETCWALCVSCNVKRTEKIPSTDHWNEVRHAFCVAQGFVFTPHIGHQPVPRRRS